MALIGVEGRPVGFSGAGVSSTRITKGGPEHSLGYRFGPYSGSIKSPRSAKVDVGLGAGIVQGATPAGSSSLDRLGFERSGMNLARRVISRAPELSRRVKTQVHDSARDVTRDTYPGRRSEGISSDLHDSQLPVMGPNQEPFFSKLKSKAFHFLVMGSLMIAAFEANAASATAAVPAPLVSVTPQAALTIAEYWRYFFAGGVCACLSHTVATPVDVVKTRQQTNPERYTGLSLSGVFRKITQEEGPAMLLKGIGPTALGYLFEGALKFGFYEFMKPIVFAATGGQSKFLDFMISGIVAGSIASVALCPLEAARIRLVADPKFAKGLFDAIPKMMRERGAVQVLFAGLPAQMAKQVPYTVTKQVSFDFLTAKAYGLAAAIGIATAGGFNKWAITLSSALIAAVLSTLTSQPGDMLLSAVNKGNGERLTTKEAAKKIYKKDGIRGLFRGTFARMIHVGTIVTFQLTIYDVVKQACGIPPTGSV